MLTVILRLRKIGDERGAFSLLEVLAAVTIIAFLAGIAVPTYLKYREDAERVRAEADVKEIANQIGELIKHVGHFPYYDDGTQNAGPPDFELLKGPGTPPLPNPNNPDLDQAWVGKPSDLLENHIVKNNPRSKKYAEDGRFRWRGYLQKVDPDPWGNHYLVNIGNADPAINPRRVVFVISAGPNHFFETAWNPRADSGPVPGGDDIVLRIQ